MSEAREIELVFEPDEEGGYHVYAPDLPGLHTQGEDIEDASRNVEEALALYVEGLREDGGSLDTGVIRRKFPLPACARDSWSSPAKRWAVRGSPKHRH
jgi:predicted RNase H-like HicB family nuclease